MNSIQNLTPQQLRNAAEIQERILELQAELAQVLDSGVGGGVSAPIKKRQLSAQGLANIRAGARKRWGKLKSDKPVTGEAQAPRRKMSAAGKARIAAALKARWAAAKKAGRNAL